jgi:hypothetical protein
MKTTDFINFAIGAKNTLVQSFEDFNRKILNSFESYKYAGEMDMSEPAIKLKVKTAWFLVSWNETVKDIKNSLIKETK